MECTECNSKTKVIDSRDVGDGSIRRRRECLHCHHRFTTYEILKDVLLSGVPDPPTSKRPRKNAPPYKGGPSHYVYYLIDPRDNEVFYVGKGQGNRMLEHEWNVRAGRKTENTMTERIITEILDAGENVITYIADRFEYESDAFREEAKRIRSLSTDKLTNIIDYHRVGGAN